MSVASVIHFRRLLNHHAEWFREYTTRDEFGDVLVAWAQLDTPEGNNCRPDQAWSGVLQDHGPGEQQSARRRWFLDKTFEGVAERDVIRITAGVESPKLLRIESVTPQWDRSQLHHIEVNVEVYVGDLDELIDAPPDTPVILEASTDVPSDLSDLLVVDFD